jgi:anti-sigma B factor antagonist
VEIAHNTVGDVLVVVPQGDYLDASNTNDFRNDMGPLIDKHSRVLMDLGRLQFIDSSGCGAFIHLLRRLKSKGGDMKLCNINKPIRALFELVRMHRVFDIYNTSEEALRAFQG